MNLTTAPGTKMKYVAKTRYGLMNVWLTEKSGAQMQIGKKTKAVIQNDDYNQDKPYIE